MSRSLLLLVALAAAHRAVGSPLNRSFVSFPSSAAVRQFIHSGLDSIGQFSDEIFKDDFPDFANVGVLLQPRSFPVGDAKFLTSLPKLNGLNGLQGPSGLPGVNVPAEQNEPNAPAAEEPKPAVS